MKFSIYLVFIFFLSAAACKKLHVYPANVNADGNLIVDQQTAQTVLNGVYYRFANADSDDYQNPITKWTDIYELFPSEMAGSAFSTYGYSGDSTYDFTFSPANYAIDPKWIYGYNLVNAANGFIKNAVPATNLAAAVKQQMLAEARFLRAFGNAGLLLSFGQYGDPSSKYGIILRDTFVTVDNLTPPRSGVAAVYTSILADLDAAIQGLPVLNSAIYYANASVAKLLKARVLMNRGTAGDYAQVIALTNDIIINGPFLLEDSTKDLFQTNGFSSREVMLGIQPYPTESYKQYTQSIPTDSLLSLFANDARTQWMFRSDTSYIIITLIAKYPLGDLNNPAPVPLAGNCYAFRLSEAYLLEAEAIALSGGDLGMAKNLLVTVMSHAGAGPQELAAAADASTPAALQLEIVKEDLRNFVCENGVDWLALRRLPFATMQQLNPYIKDASRLILPIPSAEITLNPNIIQNPGY
jgi:hypothetical protein